MINLETLKALEAAVHPAPHTMSLSAEQAYEFVCLEAIPALLRELEASRKESDVLFGQTIATVKAWRDKCSALHGELEAARADNAALLNMLNRLSVKWGSAFKASLGVKVQNDHEDVVAFGSELCRLLRVIHPGDALLRELEASRKVIEAAEARKCVPDDGCTVCDALDAYRATVQETRHETS